MTTTPETPTATAVTLRVEEVSKSFPLPAGGTVRILDSLSFDVEDIPGRGQVHAILGPSGCGKTTLFRIVAGLDAPDAGRVLLGPTMEPVSVGRVGVIFQSYPLFEHLRVFDNLVAPARRLGVKADEARTKAAELLDYFNLMEKRDAYPVELSGGQRQRVAIIQQLMTDKNFVVMDEPFSGLDMVNGLKLADMLARITAADVFDVTILVVTHDISMAIAVSDHIHLIGRVRDDAGALVAGAGSRIVRQYDLIERGLAYQADITSRPEYQTLRTEIAREFPKL